MVFTFEARQRSRTTDPETSKLAAEKVSGAESQRAVLAALLAVDFGLADFELERRLAPMFSGSRVRTARKELERQGRVEYIGFDRMTPSGHRARVWTAVAA